MDRTGTIQWVEDISREFDIRDEEGRLHRLTSGDKSGASERLTR